MIEFKRISKNFGDFRALKDINFIIETNTVHSIIGENGAGKSTLMKILSGIERATSGDLYLKGQLYSPHSAQDAYKNKIGLVHQHFQLADELTGWQHLELVGDTQNISKKQLKNSVTSTQKKFKWDLPLDKTIKDYSIGEQQRLEILRVLIFEPEIIIFDEPTAVLSPEEIEQFLDFMLDLKKQGHTLILISHKLKEVKKVSDNITILLHGEIVGHFKNEAISLENMAEKMIGRKQKEIDLGLLSNQSTLKTLFTLTEENLEIKCGEILGVAGVDGNGQESLMKSLKDISEKKDLNIGDISEDRYRYSIYPCKSIAENFLIKHRYIFTGFFGFLKTRNLNKVVYQVMQDWDVRPLNPHQLIGELSGGNQQKFVIGRELWNKPDIILAAHPSRGVDIGAQEKIHQALITERNHNKAVVLLSSDLDEVLKLSDRFVIMYKNKIKGPFTRGELTLSEISQTMNGVL